MQAEKGRGVSTVEMSLISVFPNHVIFSQGEKQASEHPELEKERKGPSIKKYKQKIE